MPTSQGDCQGEMSYYVPILAQNECSVSDGSCHCPCWTKDLLPAAKPAPPPYPYSLEKLGPLEVAATWLLTPFSDSVHCRGEGLKSNQMMSDNHSDILTMN